MPEQGPAGAPPDRPSGRLSFVRNALSSYGQRVLLGLSVLLVTPYLFRHLGTAGFGTWSVMSTLTTIFTMIQVGFSAGSIKFVAEHRAKRARGELESTLGASLVLMTGMGLLAFAGCALLGFLATGLAGGGEVDDFRTGMLILGLAFLIRFPLMAYESLLAGYQRYDLYYVGSAVTVVGAGIGSIAAVALGAGVLGVAIAQAAALVAGGLVTTVFALRIDHTLRLRPQAGDRATRRRILGFNSFTLLADGMMFIGARMDTIIIAAIRNASQAAPFAAASKFQNGIQALTLPVIDLMIPMISDLDARGMREAVVRRLTVATRITLQVTFPVALAVAFFSADIVDVWLGHGAPSITASILTVMALQTLMMSAVPADKVLVGVGRARTVGLLNTAEGLANLVISVVLVTAYGAIGAALGTLISSWLIGPAKFPLACSATDYPLSRLLRTSLAPATLASIPSAAVMLGIWLLMSPGVGRMLIGGTLGLGVACLIGLLQLGPRRAIAEVRGGLGGRQEEIEETLPPAQLAAEGPS